MTSRVHIVLLLLSLVLAAAGHLSDAETTVVVPTATDPLQNLDLALTAQADGLIAAFSEANQHLTVARLAAEDFGGATHPREVNVAAFTSAVAPAFVPCLLATGALLDAGRQGLFRDVRPLLEAHGVYESVPLSLRKALSLDNGGLMALPTSASDVKVFCPAQLLTDGQVPQSFADFVQVLERAKSMGLSGPVRIINHYDLTSLLMLNTYGPRFTQDVIDGSVPLTDDRLRPWAEAVALLHQGGLVKNMTSVDIFVNAIFGGEGCVVVGAAIYGTLGFPQPAHMVGPFDLPGIQGHLLEEPGFKAAVAEVAIAFVPSLSSQAEYGIDIVDFVLTTCLGLVERGGPFTEEESVLIGVALPFAPLESLRRSPSAFAVHIEMMERLLDIDTVVLGLGVGSPVQIGFDYIDFMDSVLYNVSRPDLTADSLMSTLEAIRVEKFLSAALPPVADIEQGLYEDDIDVTLSSLTAGAEFHVTLDGEQPTEASPTAADGKVTISASGTTTLRAIAVVDGLNPSSDVSFVYTIERMSTDNTALIIGVVCAVLVAVVFVVGFVAMRKRSQLSLVDGKEVETNQVIGIGGRSVVFAGTYRGADVAVKEFVTRERMAEIINEERSKLSKNNGSFGATTTSNGSSNKRHSTLNISQALLTNAATATRMGSGGQSTANERKQQGHEFKREVRALNRVRHPNIVAFLGAFETGKRRGIILELMERGSLADVLANPSQILGWKQRVRMALDASRGLAYLHAQSPPILHHDVKSLNMLIDENNGCKVSDFGASVDAGGEMNAMGTVAWMAPEVLRKEPYTAASDVYSFGIVLWEIASRAEPTNGRPIGQIRPDTLAGKRLPIDRDSWPEELCDLIEECWAQEPAKRPLLSDVSTRLATMMTELPEDVKSADTHSITAGSVVVGKEAMKEMQSKLLGGAMPRAQVVEQVSVLFTDIVSFTRLSSLLDPADVADLLNRFFSTLDELAAKYGVRRYQTVGDAYIAIAHASTQPDKANLKAGETWTPEKAICDFGIAAVKAAGQMSVLSDGRAPPSGFHSLAIRAGIASGPVAFQLVTFDRMEILGDTVNLASRMESTGVADRVQVSEAHYATVHRTFSSAKKHSANVKGKGRMTTYLLDATSGLATVSSSMLVSVSEVDGIHTGASEASLSLPGQA